MSNAKLLITCSHLLRHIDRYRPMMTQAGFDLSTPTLINQQFDSNEMATLMQGHDIAILGDDEVPEFVLARAAPKLKAIIRWGIGTDNVDLNAARRLNIDVINTPGQFSNEVADLALGLLLAVARRISITDKAVRDGYWPRFEGKSLTGQTAGIIGFGGIGSAIAKRALAFGMNIIGFDPYFSDAQETTALVSLEKLASSSDVVFVACNLANENRHLIDDDFFERMQPSSILVNVARGPLVKETALIKALSSGQIAGAGLDVFEIEPLAKNHALSLFDNVVLGAHGGSSTSQSIQRVNELTLDIAKSLHRADYTLDRSMSLCN